MANFNLPALTSTYTNFITELKARDNEVASLFSSGSTFTGTYPVRAIRWNASNGYFERRNAANNGFERLEGASGTHKFVNIEAGNITGTSTVAGSSVNASDQLQGARVNVTGGVKPANGLYRPVANEVRFTTNSTDRLTIESNGEVGISTVDPQEKLHVVGNARIVNGSSTVNLDIGKSGGADHASNISIYSDNSANYGFKIARASGTNGTTQLLHNGTGAFSINAVDAADLKLATQGTTRMCVDSGGNIGIGNFDNPSANLHFYTSSSSANYVQFQNSEGSQYIRGDGDALHLDADTLKLRSEGGSDRAFLNSSGFGIGGSPSVKFYVASTGNTYTDPSNNNVAAAYIYNSNSTATGHAVLAVRSNSANGGDAFLSLDINGVAGWHVGIDNSDSDKFKIGRSWSSVGSSNALAIDSSLNAVFSGSVTASSFSGNGANVTNVNATTLDSIDSSQFVRNDINQTVSGVINFSGKKIGLGTTPGGNLNGRNAAIALGDNDTGVAQNGDGQLELWANNQEIMNLDTGEIECYRDVVPNGTRNLGSSGNPWQNLFINDLNMSNKGKQNDVDGTWGDYTIQEGHEDLFLINHRTGKKFKFALIPVA